MVDTTYYPRFSGAANSCPLAYVFCTAGSPHKAFNGSRYRIGNGSPVLSEGRLSTSCIYRRFDDKTAISCSSSISIIVAIPAVIFSNAIFLSSTPLYQIAMLNKMELPEILDLIGGISFIVDQTHLFQSTISYASRHPVNVLTLSTSH